MEGTLFILVYFVMRVGVPVLVLLTIGETIKRHYSGLRLKSS